MNGLLCEVRDIFSYNVFVRIFKHCMVNQCCVTHGSFRANSHNFQILPQVYFSVFNENILKVNLVLEEICATFPVSTPDSF